MPGDMSPERASTPRQRARSRRPGTRLESVLLYMSNSPMTPVTCAQQCAYAPLHAAAHVSWYSELAAVGCASTSTRTRATTGARPGAQEGRRMSAGSVGGKCRDGLPRGRVLRRVFKRERRGGTDGGRCEGEWGRRESLYAPSSPAQDDETR